MVKQHKYFWEEQKHVCTICGKPFLWSDQSSYFGNCDEAMYKACTKKCLNKCRRSTDDVIKEEK